jgi:hypothetical protein
MAVEANCSEASLLKLKESSHSVLKFKKLSANLACTIKFSKPA